MTITENTIEIAERSIGMIIPTDSERAAVKALCIAARKSEERIKELEEALRGVGNKYQGDICFCPERSWTHERRCQIARKALHFETRTD